MENQKDRKNIFLSVLPMVQRETIAANLVAIIGQETPNEERKPLIRWLKTRSTGHLMGGIFVLRSLSLQAEKQGRVLHEPDQRTIDELKRKMEERTDEVSKALGVNPAAPRAPNEQLDLLLTVAEAMKAGKIKKPEPNPLWVQENPDLFKFLQDDFPETLQQMGFPIVETGNFMAGKDLAYEAYRMQAEKDRTA